MQRAIYISETQGLHSLHKLCMNCQLRGRVVERRVGSGRRLHVRKNDARYRNLDLRSADLDFSVYIKTTQKSAKNRSYLIL